jgi:anti-sigma regulatory factor (Ser/Thr protein kinase)
MGLGTGEHDHEVAVYETVRELGERVAAFVAAGLTSGERCLMLARPTLRLAVDDALLALGVDIVEAERTGGYVPLDAETTLNRFLVDGTPDAERFMTLAAESMPDDDRPTRAYGEMVSLLWERGDVVVALQLEALWTAYSRGRPITILCSYPVSAVSHADLGDVARLCELHSHIAYAGDYTLTELTSDSSDAASGVLVPVPAAVAAARHFVVDVLRSWGRRDLAGDAALVISELATNAVTHGGSPFRARIHREQDTVRVSIEDVAPTWPERQEALPTDLDGRGLAIVEAVADRCGCSVSPQGKVAWAELSA